ncbi:MAG: hypothetical protein KC619_09310 [Myxococcales bacterium]|nr:hypothetical protein [Myxococcales bacterium]
MTPKRPNGPALWKSLGPADGLPGSRTYRHRHLQVISGVEAGEWHVSVASLRLGTVSDGDLALVREAFGMVGAVEERGALRGGRVRHLWLPVLAMAS